MGNKVKNNISKLLDDIKNGEYMALPALKISVPKENKCWYYKTPLRGRPGFITDQFDEFYEIQDKDTGEFVIIHSSKVEKI
jgi:hypothetical protein